MTSSQAPHWGLIIFMVAMFAFSFLLQSDTTITTSGSAAGDITAFPTLDTTDLFTTFISAGAVLIGIFGLLVSVVTFSNLGLPPIVQWAFAIPCILIMLWTMLAFAGAVRNSLLGGS